MRQYVAGALLLLLSMCQGAMAQDSYEVNSWHGAVRVNDEPPQKRMKLDMDDRLDIPGKCNMRIMDTRHLITLLGRKEGTVEVLVDEYHSGRHAGALAAIKYIWNEVRGMMTTKEQRDFTASTGSTERGDEMTFTDSIYIAIRPFIQNGSGSPETKLKYEWVKDKGSDMMHLRLKNNSSEMLAVNVVCQYEGCRPLLWFAFDDEDDTEEDAEQLPCTIVMAPRSTFDVADLLRASDEKCAITVFGTRRRYNAGLLQEWISSGWNPEPGEADIVF